MTNGAVDTAIPTLKVMRLQKPDLHMVRTGFLPKRERRVILLHLIHSTRT
jgi:hypothetical protein